LNIFFSAVSGLSKVKGVNLVGWLVIEGWIKPSLFDAIPNGDMPVGGLLLVVHCVFLINLNAYEVLITLWGFICRMGHRCSSAQWY
jgi:hypothetical protein